MSAPALRHVIAATLGLSGLLLAPGARADEFPRGARDALGPEFGAAREHGRPRPSPARDAIRRWNRIAIDASGLDHTPVAAGETRVYGEQLGPGRSSRAMAIVHVAIFEAVNAIHGGYRSYVGLRRSYRDTSFEAAVASAAHAALVELFPSQAASLDERLAEDLAAIPWWRAREGERRRAGSPRRAREADGDGNPGTVPDPTFSPLGAPASNPVGPNFTPPFPAYPSGHAGFGGALFQTLRNFYATDDIAFGFVSDELDGVTLDNQGNVRPLRPRFFDSLSQAEEENGQSRIYLGIHWSFDKTAGIAQGRRVADHVFANLFRPRRRGARARRPPRASPRSTTRPHWRKSAFTESDESSAMGTRSAFQIARQ